MKPRVLILSLLPILIILASTLLTYQVFSFYQKPPELIDSDTTITQIVSEDIGPPPKVIYNQSLGIVESQDKPELASMLEDFNLALNRIYRYPLNISLKDGSLLTDISLDSQFLRSLLIPTTTELNVPPSINKSLLLSYLDSRLTPKQKQYFNPEFAYENTQKAINLRFMGEATPVVLGVDDGPSSSGELARKYLEIDLSQQKMYFFIDNTLFQEYRVSTGAEYPTPIGEYHILNKAPKAFSDIYKVWMPYWMGFTYARDVGAYLGIHEIAYAVNDLGKPFYKHGYYIGDMMTGGCVAMEPSDSREIYDLSDIGMLVRIVP